MVNIADKPLYFKICVLLFFLGLIQTTKGQQYTVSGQVKSAQTQLGVPFANIKIRGGLAGLGTDSAGFFRFSTKAAQIKLRVSSVGFKPKEITIRADSYADLMIILDPEAVDLDALTIKPAENPAWEIIRKILANRDLHNPTMRETYEANVYTKIKTVGEDILKPRADSVKKKEPPLMFEFASKAYYRKPNQKKEIIFAASTNFLKTYASVLPLLPWDVHVIHFYDEKYNFYPQKRIYINPLNKDTFSQYDWVLQDTTGIVSDIYILDYKPYKGRNFNGFKGQMHIDKKDFAMTFMEAATGDSLQQLQIHLKHYYQKTVAGWFPREINTNLELRLQNGKVSGKVKVDLFSAFDSVKINHDLPKKIFDGVTLEIKRGAEKVSDSTFNTYRTVPLDSIEALKPVFRKNKLTNSIVKIDKKYSGRIQDLGAGVIDLKVAELIMTNAISINRIEGLKVGFTVSNRYIDKPRFGLRISPGFGILDQRFKLKTELNWFITKDRFNRLSVGYVNGYKNTVNQDNLMGPNLMYPFESQIMPFSKSDLKNMKINRQEGIFARLFLKPLPYTILKLEYLSNTNTPYNANILGDSINYDKKEISAHVRFSYKEKITRSGLIETALNWYSPIINLKVAKGLSQTGYGYWRVNFDQFYQFRYKRIGITELSPRVTLLNGRYSSDFLLESVSVNRVFYKDPAKLLESLKAENSKSAFRQLDFNISHDFNNFLLKPKTPYSQPRIRLFYNINYNWLDFKSTVYKQNTNSQYAGIEVRNLLRIPIKKYWIGLGTQVSYYFGPNAPENTRERLRVGLRVF